MKRFATKPHFKRVCVNYKDSNKQEWLWAVTYRSIYTLGRTPQEAFRRLQEYFIAFTRCMNKAVGMPR